LPVSRSSERSASKRAGGRNGVTLMRVSLLSKQRRIQLGVESAPINYFGRSKFIAHELAFAFASGFRKAAVPASDTWTRFGSGEASAS